MICRSVERGLFRPSLHADDKPSLPWLARLAKCAARRCPGHDGLAGTDIALFGQVPPQQPPGLYWYHTHSHGESYIQDLDGMSGAIVVEGIERYVPEVRNMRERILVPARSCSAH